MYVQLHSNLTEYLKASTSRDFRINAASLEQAMQRGDSDGEQSEGRRKHKNVITLVLALTLRTLSIYIAFTFRNGAS